MRPANLSPTNGGKGSVLDIGGLALHRLEVGVKEL
jgi:hypothetical protein